VCYISRRKETTGKIGSSGRCGKACVIRLAGCRLGPSARTSTIRAEQMDARGGHVEICNQEVQLVASFSCFPRSAMGVSSRHYVKSTTAVFNS
jgi:hypothetical protein